MGSWITVDQHAQPGDIYEKKNIYHLQTHHLCSQTFQESEIPEEGDTFTR